MPIRIKHRDKPRDRVQPTKDKGLGALLATGSMAYYAGRNPRFCIFMGISLIIVRPHKDGYCNTKGLSTTKEYSMAIEDPAITDVTTKTFMKWDLYKDKKPDEACLQFTRTQQNCESDSGWYWSNIGTKRVTSLSARESRSLCYC